MEIDFRLIGKRIKEVRAQRGMSQADLAEEVNLSVPYISFIETDNKQASLTALVSIADALCVSVDVLLFGNQKYDLAAYSFDLAQLISDCDSYERQVIYDTVLALKNTMKANRWHKLKQ